MLTLFLQLRHRIKTEKEHSRLDRDSAQNLYEALLNDIKDMYNSINNKKNMIQKILDDIAVDKIYGNEFIINKVNESLDKSECILKKLNKQINSMNNSYKFKNMYLMYELITESRELNNTLSKYLEDITKLKLINNK